MSSSSDRSSAARGPRLDVENKLLRVRSLITAGDLVGARSISDAILAEHPTDAGALIQRSRLESIDDNYRRAREYALSAYRVGVQNKRQCMFLLRRLKTFNLIPELHGFIPRIPEGLRHDVDVAQLVALFLQTLNHPQQALQHLQLAAAHHPSSAPLTSDIGLALLNLGRFEEAEQHFRESLVLQPDHAPAWWHLSRLRSESGTDAGHVDALKRAVARAAEPGNAALLAYALHRELDRLEDYAAATDALELACTSMRKVVAYSGEEDERLFGLLKSLDVGAAERPSSMDAPFTPVFIVGMHRSGTTLLEQLLSAHTDICSGANSTTSPASYDWPPITTAAPSSMRPSSRLRRTSTMAPSAGATWNRWTGVARGSDSSPTSCRPTSSTSVSSSPRCLARRSCTCRAIRWKPASPT